MKSMKKLKYLAFAAAMTAAAVMPIGAGAADAAPAGEPAAAQQVLWADGSAGKIISFEEMMEGLAPYQVVVFGEFHDSQPIHDGELALLKGLYDKHGDKLVLSMEMFERDVQPVMNAYLAGEIAEDEFLSRSRPWPQYEEAYKPMVEFAREKGIPVLTGNIPRRMAAVYAKTRSLDAVAENDQPYLPKVHQAGSEAYRKKFAAVMAEMSGIPGGMNVPPAMVQPMFMAQCLKDDAMAESIADYISAHADAVIYHVVGNFHSEGYLGAVEKLHGLAPELSIAVINSVHYDPAEETAADAAGANQDGGDYLALETVHGTVQQEN